MRRVSYARMHQNVFAPGVSDLGNVFPPPSKTLANLEMTVDLSGLTAVFYWQGIKQELLIPSANIVIMKLLPEEKPAQAAVKVVKSA